MVNLRIFIALLLLSPAAMADLLVIKSRDVDKLIVEIADWSKEFDWPDGPRAVYRFLFCQKRTWGEPKSDTQSCYIVLYARGVDNAPGYIRFAEIEGTDEAGSTGWFLATPEWNHRFKRRIANRERTWHAPAWPNGVVQGPDAFTRTLDQIPTYPVPNTVIGPVAIPGR